MIPKPELGARHRNNGYKLPRASHPRVTRVGHFLRFSLRNVPVVLTGQPEDPE